MQDQVDEPQATGDQAVDAALSTLAGLGEPVGQGPVHRVEQRDVVTDRTIAQTLEGRQCSVYSLVAGRLRLAHLVLHSSSSM